MDRESGREQRKTDAIIGAAVNGQAGPARGKRLDKGRRAILDTCNGPIVIDLPTEGQIVYVPFTVPAGVVVRFEDIEVGEP